MNVADGDGGGDAGLMDAFVSALAGDPSKIISVRGGLLPATSPFSPFPRINSTIENNYP